MTLDEQTAVERRLRRFSEGKRTAIEAMLMEDATDLLKEAKRLREQRDEARALVRDADRVRPAMHLWVDGHDAIARWSAEEAAEATDGND